MNIIIIIRTYRIYIICTSYKILWCRPYASLIFLLFTEDVVLKTGDIYNSCILIWYFCSRTLVLITTRFHNTHRYRIKLKAYVYNMYRRAKCFLPADNLLELIFGETNSIGLIIQWKRPIRELNKRLPASCWGFNFGVQLSALNGIQR